MLLIRLLTLMLTTLAAGHAVAAPGFSLGVINERPDNPEAALAMYAPIHGHLAATLAPAGVRLEPLVVARSLDEMASLIRDGAVDGLLESVMATLELDRRGLRLQPSLVGWRKGQRQYHSVFFVRRDDDIHALDDLRGRTIAFESARSTSAYFVPRITLQAAGLEPEPAADGGSDSVRYLFAGSEANQGYWVERGKVDAGAFNDGDWERLPAQVRADLRIIHRTPPILRFLLSFHADVAPATRQRVAEALIAMEHSEAGRDALAAAARISRFERLTADDRASLAHWRDLLERFR